MTGRHGNRLYFCILARKSSTGCGTETEFLQRRNHQILHLQTLAPGTRLRQRPSAPTYLVRARTSDPEPRGLLQEVPRLAQHLHEVRRRSAFERLERRVPLHHRRDGCKLRAGAFCESAQVGLLDAGGHAAEADAERAAGLAGDPPCAKRLKRARVKGD